MHQNSVFLLNADFDVALAGYSMEKYHHLVDELSLLASLLGKSDDCFVADVRADDDYFRYLDDAGIEYARPAPADCSSYVPRLWGVSDDAVSRIRVRGVAEQLPDSAVVAQVNSRVFSNELCARFGWPCGEIYPSINDALSAITVFPVVLKPIFGSSGTMFEIMRELPDAKKEGRMRRKYGNTTLLMEPWRDRIADYSASFMLSRDGDITGFHVRILRSSARGTFEGITLLPDEELRRDPWYDRIESAAREVAQSLHLAGYFGPASIDCYSFRENGDIAFNPVSEINARMTMADLARALKEKTNARYASIRMIQRSSFPLLQDNQSFASLPGCTFSRERRSGVICATPLHYTTNQGERRESQRLLLFFAAESRKALAEAERSVDRILWHRGSSRDEIG